MSKETNKKIIFTQAGNVHDDDVEALKQNGVIVIQVHDVSKLKTMSDLSVLGVDEICVTALEVLNAASVSSSIHGDFARKLLSKVIKKQSTDL